MFRWSLWNKERPGLMPLVEHLDLADQAYAGAAGEGGQLVRPVQRGERDYLENPGRAKAFNPALWFGPWPWRSTQPERRGSGNSAPSLAEPDFAERQGSFASGHQLLLYL
jgi:hypothetical protein